MKSRYTKDYEYRDVIDENGKASSELVYTGVYHDSTLTAEQMQTLRRRAVGSSILALALMAAGGFMPSGASRSFLVMLPYLACLGSLFFLTAGSVMLCRVPERMTEKQYEHSFARTARSSILAGFFAVIACLTDVIYLIRHRRALVLPGDLILLVMLILTAVIVILFYRRSRDDLNAVLAA